MSSNHYTPEMTPQAMPQEQIMPPKPVADTQVIAPASQSPAMGQDGITSEKYEKATDEILDAGIVGGEISEATNSLISGIGGAAAAAAGSQIWKQNRSWGAAGMFAIGGALGGVVASSILTLFSKSKVSEQHTTELGQAIAQHEAWQGAAPQAPQMQPAPEQMAAMQNYQPTPEEMAQLEAMQQQAMQEMNMLAQMKLDDSAHPAVKQMQGLAQTMVAGQELSPEQQQQAAALMDQIANSPELQHEIEASLKKRPEYDGPTPDTVEKVAPKAVLPSPHSVTPESAERVQEPASREVS